MSLQKELEALINTHSAENESDTPDYILASYVSDCLSAFNRAVNQREAWYGRKTQESEEPVNSPASPVQQLKDSISLLNEIVAEKNCICYLKSEPCLYCRVVAQLAKLESI